MRAWSGVFVALAVGLILAVGAGSCSRLDRLSARIDAISSDRARVVVRDCLWEHGSHYQWARHRSIRCEVERTDHRPGGDVASEEVWLLDIVGDRVRVEKPDLGRTVVFDGLFWRVFEAGKETKDLEARAEAAGDARMVRELVPMPFSLLRPGLGIEYLGSYAGPGEARAWDRLLVRYGRESGSSDRDRAVVEIRQDTSRLEAVIIRWSELPFVGRRYRVELDDWRPEAGLLVSHRWRFFAVDETDKRIGPARWTVRIKRLQWDVPMPARTFWRP